MISLSLSIEILALEIDVISRNHSNLTIASNLGSLSWNNSKILTKLGMLNNTFFEKIYLVCAPRMVLICYCYYYYYSKLAFLHHIAIYLVVVCLLSFVLLLLFFSSLLKQCAQ